MTEKDFVMWLHGYLEIENPETIDKRQLQIIKDHLNTFFKKVTPDREKELEKLSPLVEGFLKQKPIRTKCTQLSRDCLSPFCSVCSLKRVITC